MIKKITNLNVKDDPIRPELEFWWRLLNGREVYGSFEDDPVRPELKSVVCVAKMNFIPKTTHDLRQSKISGDIMVAYTLWSYEKGWGSKLIDGLKQTAQNQYMKRLVTLSPLTEMARSFHLKNGAKELQTNHSTRNFEYEL